MLAQNYPYFTQKELNKIALKNPISKNRILDYEKHIQKFNSLTKEEQLKRVNAYLNRLQAQYDDITQNKEDSWATPKEFLELGYGDCEDYVLIKYYSLIRLGFDEKKLFITIVKEKFRGGTHMVLSYFKTPLHSPLILDNLSFKILSLDTRVDLQAEYFINSTGVYKLDNNLHLKKIADKFKEFEEIRVKVSKKI